LGDLAYEERRGVNPDEVEPTTPYIGLEQMTEERLVIFDILTKPRVDITAKEEKQVKKVAKDMLQMLKAKALVLDWRKRQQTRAAVRLCIEEWLDKLPPVYTSAIYQTKCDAVYQHVYDMYTGGVAG
jgi:type I restriction enzyme R subunit